MSVTLWDIWNTLDVDAILRCSKVVPTSNTNYNKATVALLYYNNGMLALHHSSVVTHPNFVNMMVTCGLEEGLCALGYYLPTVLEAIVIQYVDPYDAYLYNRRSPAPLWDKLSKDITNTEMVQYVISKEDVDAMPYIRIRDMSKAVLLARQCGHVEMLKHLKDLGERQNLYMGSKILWLDILYEAIEKDDEPNIQWILDPKSGVVIREWSSIFSVAASKNRMDIIQTLINRGLINKQTYGDVLSGAVQGNHTKLIEWAILRGANINGTLNDAALGGNIAIINQILSAKENPVNIKDVEASLFIAITNGHLEAAKILYTKAVEEPHINPFHYQWLHAAAENGDLPMLQWLISLDGIDEMLRDSVYDMFLILDEAAEHKHCHIIDWLIEQKYAKYGDGILTGAAKSGNIELMERATTLTMRNDACGEALHNATIFGHLTAVKWLASRYEYNWQFAFRDAIMESEPEIMEFIYEHHGPIDISNVEAKDEDINKWLAEKKKIDLQSNI